MNLWMVLILSVGSPFAGAGFIGLQARLERWDYERHVHD